MISLGQNLMSMRATMPARGPGAPLPSPCGFFPGGDSPHGSLGRRASGRPLGSLRRAGSVLSTDNQLSSSQAALDSNLIGSLCRPSSKSSNKVDEAETNNITRGRHSRPKSRKPFMLEEQQQRPATPAGDTETEQPDGRPSTPAQRPRTPVVEEPCGLTPASLKHLRRQKESLAEDKERLLAEVARLRALLEEQRGHVAELEAAAPAGAAIPEPRQADTSKTLALAKEDKEASANAESDGANLRRQIGKLEEERSLLEATLQRREAEVAKLRAELQEQMQLNKDQREAKEYSSESEARALDRAASLAARMQKLEAQLLQLTSERGQLEEQKGELAEQILKCQQDVSESEAKVQSVTKMHEDYKQQTEQLKTGIVGTAIQSKLELHISVPHVVLTYNNAPPLMVSTAIGLSKAKILKFLDSMLFPHFEPLWVCLDGVDMAPDGTNKKRYSSRMLERLTDSIKDFIDKSQTGDNAELGDSRPGARTDSIGKELEGRAQAKVERSTSGSGFKGLGSLRSHGR